MTSTSRTSESSRCSSTRKSGGAKASRSQSPRCQEPRKPSSVLFLTSPSKTSFPQAKMGFSFMATQKETRSTTSILIMFVAYTNERPNGRTTSGIFAQGKGGRFMKKSHRRSLCITSKTSTRLAFNTLWMRRTRRNLINFFLWRGRGWLQRRQGRPPKPRWRESPKEAKRDQRHFQRARKWQKERGEALFFLS